MIDCKQCLEGLGDYIYKQLSSHQASAIEEHLSNCPRCQQELEILSYTLGMLDKWGAIKAAPFSLAVIRARLQAAPQRGVQQLPSYVQVGVLISIGIIVFNLLLGVQGLILPPLLAHLPPGWQFIENTSAPMLLIGLILSLGGLLTLLSSPILITKRLTFRSILTGQRGGIPNDKPKG